MALGDRFPRPPSSGEALNSVWGRLVVAALWAVRPVAGKGIRIEPGPRGCIISAITQDSSGGGEPFSHPFKTTLSVTDGDNVASVVAGPLDGIESEDFAPGEVAEGSVVYAVAEYEDAYAERPFVVEIDIAGSIEALPSSHDTRWVVPIAIIEAVPGSSPVRLRVKQLVVGGQSSRRTRQRKSFDATREGDDLRIEAGRITAIVNPSFAQSVNEAHATEFPPIPDGFVSGTLLMVIDVSRIDEGDPAETTARFSISHSLAWAPDGAAPLIIDGVQNAPQGLFVDVSAVEIEPITTTLPGTPKTWAAGTLSPEYTRPSTVFRIPICDLEVFGDDWTIRQRQCGDIQLPLQTNWGWPSTPAS